MTGVGEKALLLGTIFETSVLDLDGIAEAILDAATEYSQTFREWSQDKEAAKEIADEIDRDIRRSLDREVEGDTAVEIFRQLVFKLCAAYLRLRSLGNDVLEDTSWYLDEVCEGGEYYEPYAESVYFLIEQISEIEMHMGGCYHTEPLLRTLEQGEYEKLSEEEKDKFWHNLYHIATVYSFLFKASEKVGRKSEVIASWIAGTALKFGMKEEEIRGFIPDWIINEVKANA